MKRILLALFALICGFSFLLGSWSVLHNDIQFTSDVARDFLLLAQISQKGIVLIGPSSSTKLFHGILWMYLNYPVFWLSHGNPVASGWFWVALSVASCIAGFIVAKKLFNSTTAYIFVVLLSLFLGFHLRYLYNPDGVMLILPTAFFFFIRYLETKKLKFLIFHILLLGACIQFELAIGIPLAILSFLYVLVQTIKCKKYLHLLAYLLILLTVGNFIIFDLRHQFLLTHLTLHFLTSAGRDHGNISSMIWQRILFLSNVEFLRVNFWNLNAIIFLLLLVAMLLQIKHKSSHAYIYKVFLYFYLGFFVLSLGNAGGLLPFYVYPLFPLVFLMFASFASTQYKFIFALVFLMLLYFNIREAFSQMQLENGLAGNTQDSWLFQKQVAQNVFNGKEQTFGYFVFDPDIVAYQPKYAMIYESKISRKTALYFTKQPITYLVIVNNSYGEDLFWQTKLLHITSQPASIKTFPTGYKIEKYMLSGKDLTTSPEPNIDPGLLFR